MIRYVFTWGNNEKRKVLKGRECIIVKRMSMNSALVEFTDNGQREVVSRNALRRVVEIEPLSGAENSIGGDSQ